MTQYQAQKTPDEDVAAGHMPYQVVMADSAGVALSVVAELADPVAASAFMEILQIKQAS